MPKKKKKRSEAENKAQEVVNAFHSTMLDGTDTDVLGSWTGNPKDGGQPEQDADDL